MTNKILNWLKDKRMIERESNLPEKELEAVNSIKVIGKYIAEYYNNKNSSFYDRGQFFVNFANEFRTIDKKILNVNGNEAIENYISIVNNYNENIDSFSRKFQNSGPFLAIPESIGYMLPPNFQFKDIGSYLFINNWSQNKDTISLIDKFEDISKNEGGYLLLNSKSQILSKIIATKDAPFNLRKSAFDKLEKLSYDSERKPNETYEGGIMKTDLTYRDLILDELFANQNMEIEGFRKQPRDEVVNNVLKQIGLYKGNETYKIDNGEIK